MYLNRTEDPWFAATTPATGELKGWYLPNEPATVLGCTSERIYCNPNQQNASGCLNLWESGEDDFQKAWPDPEDRLALRPLSVILQQFGAAGLKSYFDAKSVSSLLARQTLYPLDFWNTNYTTVQTKALPSDQWQKELEYVGQATLSAIQHFIVDYARGVWLGGPLCEEEPCRRTCYSQKVRSSKHYSFSVLGVGIILAGGGFIMVAAMLLEPILAGLFKLHWFANDAKMRYAYAEWQAGSTLQLQRLAHEGVGAGTWSNTTGTVPLTQPGETLAVLDISDRTHARLVRPSVELTKVDYADTSLTKRPSVRYAKLPSSEQM
ncbi:hypothetical protein N0V94_003195 [Neodidymelliopsis sp. IMI 364377]|nr:hypothetical protein N0V94_003195 [Neodidymelliopsis sp. IMI 364377]